MREGFRRGFFYVVGVGKKLLSFVFFLLVVGSVCVFMRLVIYIFERWEVCRFVGGFWNGSSFFVNRILFFVRVMVVF